MSKQPGSHNTPRAVVEEILRLHIEEGYSYRQLGGEVPKAIQNDPEHDPQRVQEAAAAFGMR